jgi:hypothetical protein
MSPSFDSNLVIMTNLVRLLEKSSDSLQLARPSQLIPAEHPEEVRWIDANHPQG